MIVKNFTIKPNDYGGFTEPYKNGKKMKIRLFLKQYSNEQTNYNLFPYKRIVQKDTNLYAIESDLDKYGNNTCFKPKLYQIPKFYIFYYWNKIIDFIKIIKS